MWLVNISTKISHIKRLVNKKTEAAIKSAKRYKFWAQFYIGWKKNIRYRGFQKKIKWEKNVKT